MLEIAASNQVQGIRKGDDDARPRPRDYAMIAFGGAGRPVRRGCGRLSRDQDRGLAAQSGQLVCLRLHVCDIKRDYVRTLVRQQSSAAVDELDGLWADLEKLGRDEIAAEGVARGAIVLERSADVRYVGEGHEVLVPIPAGLSVARPSSTCGRTFTGFTTTPSVSITKAARTSRS